MTKGYYVIEKGNQVLKAVYLSGDAYLDRGYGERILKAFAEVGYRQDKSVWRSTWIKLGRCS